MASAGVGFEAPPRTPTKARVSFTALQPTTPFNKDTDEDPWELFPEWQHPNSAMRQDNPSYQQEFTAAKAAETARAEGGPRFNEPLTLEEKQHQALLCHRQGPYECLRTPTRPKRQRASIPQSASHVDEQAHSNAELERLAFSPMKVDTPSYKLGLRKEEVSKPKAGDGPGD